MKLLDEHSLRAIKNLVRTGPKDDKDAKYCEQAPYFWGGRCLLLKFPFHSVALQHNGTSTNGDAVRDCHTKMPKH